MVHNIRNSIYVGKGIPFLLTFNIEQHLGSDEAFFLQVMEVTGLSSLS